MDKEHFLNIYLFQSQILMSWEYQLPLVRGFFPNKARKRIMFLSRVQNPRENILRQG